MERLKTRYLKRDDQKNGQNQGQNKILTYFLYLGDEPLANPIKQSPRLYYYSPNIDSRYYYKQH